jgi:beta-galactosidase/beta-glucuronidase
MLLNGKRIVLRGVVRHEIKLNRGRALTLGDLREEIGLMRRAGIDAVRSHPYPFDPRFFKLCARAGIAVMTELYLCGYDSWGTPWVMSETPTAPRPESEIEPGYLALLRERHHAAAAAIH